MTGKSLKAIKAEIQARPKVETLQAKDALEGENYISKTGTMVVQVISKGPDAVSLRCFSEYGDEISSDVSPTYLLTKDKTKEEFLMSKHNKAKSKVKKMVEDRAKRSSGSTATADKPKAAGSRGQKDPRTGFGTGTTAHLVGDIMLTIGVKNREQCLEAIAKKFMDATLYAGKELHWARAWYSNHVAKKPEIYKA